MRRELYMHPTMGVVEVMEECATSVAWSASPMVAMRPLTDEEREEHDREEIGRALVRFFEFVRRPPPRAVVQVDGATVRVEESGAVTIRTPGMVSHGWWDEGEGIVRSFANAVSPGWIEVANKAVRGAL